MSWQRGPRTSCLDAIVLLSFADLLGPDDDVSSLLGPDVCTSLLAPKARILALTAGSAAGTMADVSVAAVDLSVVSEAVLAAPLVRSCASLDEKSPADFSRSSLRSEGKDGGGEDDGVVGVPLGGVGPLGGGRLSRGWTGFARLVRFAPVFDEKSRPDFSRSSLPDVDVSSL